MSGAYSPGASATIAIAKQYKDAAGASAETASTQAGIATGGAGTATTQAGIATGAAGTATTQAGIATAAAGTATTQAGIATAAAGTATTQAGIATSAAGTAAANAAAGVLAATATNAATATTQAGIATAQAGIATTQAGNAAGSANAAASSLATAQGITGGVQGIGTGPLLAPRNAELPPIEPEPWPVVARGAAYQITPMDNRRALIAESGTLTWTLPGLADLAPGWMIRVWNRSGNNLTVIRNPITTDVIGGAATSLTVADGAGAMIAYRDAARFERIA